MSTTFVEHVHCSRCGKRCSGIDPELGLIVRAWVECPECLEQHERCINCARIFTLDDVRGWYGPASRMRQASVGPFCERCYALIKAHEER